MTGNKRLQNSQSALGHGAEESLSFHQSDKCPSKWTAYLQSGSTYTFYLHAEW